jgi:3-hydroxyisobutyrate dehydrogenase-like beta-hydroxyacid dehydrogenase
MAQIQTIEGNPACGPEIGPPAMHNRVARSYNCRRQGIASMISWRRPRIVVTNSNEGHIMSDITVIGLGQMGSALARAIQGAGHDLTVWNRSPAKMQPFIDDGVAGAPDVVSAIEASPVILICIDNYAVSNTMLISDEIMPLLTGCALVQLSTGTPKEAREASAWMIARDIAYLDGAILCGPKSIGTDDAEILLSGDGAAYKRAGKLLECLGGTVRYLGPNVGAAAALDLAWLTMCYGRFMAIIHAANLCKSEGVGIDDFISLFPDEPDIQRYGQVIHEESFQEYTATLQVWAAALQRIQQQGIDANINTDIPDFVASFFKKAIDAGYGQENVMALTKVLQGDSGK